MIINFQMFDPKMTLNYISKFASRILNRPVLTYFNVTIKDGKVAITMTDSYRLIKLQLGEIEDKELTFNEAFDTEFMIMIAKSLAKRRFAYYVYIDTESKLFGFGEDKEINIRWTSPMDCTYPKTDQLLAFTEEAKVYDDNIAQYFGARYSNACMDKHFSIKIPDLQRPIIFNHKSLDEFIAFTKGITEIKMYCVGEIRPVLFEFERHDMKYQVLYLPVRVE